MIQFVYSSGYSQNESSVQRRRFSDEHLRIDIGSSAANDIQLRSPTVNRYHVRIERQEDGQYELHNLGAVGSVRLNNRAVSEHALLPESAILLIGDQFLEIRRGAEVGRAKHVPSEEPSPLVLEQIEDWYLRDCNQSKHQTCHALHRHFTIGSASDCHLVIDDPYVSNCHASIEVANTGEVVCRDLNSANGIRVNGRRVQSAQLHQGDELEVAGHRYQVGRVDAQETREAPVDATRVANSRPESLYMDARKEKVYLVGKECVIGSDPDCDYFLDDESVAPRHAILRKSEMQTTLTRLPNTPPVWVNDAQVVYARALEDMDKIQIGSTVFVYQADYQDLNLEDSSTHRRRKKGGFQQSFFWLCLVIAMVVGLERFWWNAESTQAEYQLLWSVPEPEKSASPIVGPQLLDVDLDGLMEVAIFDNQGHIRIYRGQDGRLLDAIRLPSGVSWPSVAIPQDANLKQASHYVVVGNHNQVWNVAFHQQGKASVAWQKDLSPLQVQSAPLAVLATDASRRSKRAHVVIAVGGSVLKGLDAKNGDELWQIDYLAGQTGAITALESVRESEFVLLTATGQLYYLRLEHEGPKIAWNTVLTTEEKVISLQSVAWIHGTLVLIQDAAGRLVAMDANGGRQLWRSAIPQSAVALPAPIAQQNDRLWVLGSSGRLTVLAVDSGMVLESLQTSVQESFLAGWNREGASAGGSEEVIIVDIQGNLYSIGDTLREINRARSAARPASYTQAPAAADINRSGVREIVLVNDRLAIEVLSLDSWGSQAEL